MESGVMVSLRDDQLKAAEVPLYIHGTEAGRLHITQDGLYTVLEAELPGRAAELVRLWAHGEGRSAYLGVMQPRNGGLWFGRRLSRRELAAFPDPIALVSDREKEFTENDLHNTEPDAAAALHVTEQGAAGIEAETDDAERAAEPNQDADDRETEPSPAETGYRACPWPAEPKEEGLLWYKRPDGSLVSFDGISTLLALPAELRAPGPRGTERMIEGKKYLVFRT